LFLLLDGRSWGITVCGLATGDKSLGILAEFANLRLGFWAAVLHRS